MPAGRLVLLCGLPGSGKTTLARRLAVTLPAVRMCPDEWLVALGHGPHDERARTGVETLQWALARDLLRLDGNVVLENGFWSRAERDVLLAGARDLGAAVELRHLDVAVDELWRRLAARNRVRPPGTYAVTRDELLTWAGWFEAPTAAELARYDPPATGPVERVDGTGGRSGLPGRPGG